MFVSPPCPNSKRASDRREPTCARWHAGVPQVAFIKSHRRLRAATAEAPVRLIAELVAGQVALARQLAALAAQRVDRRLRPLQPAVWVVVKLIA
jgi:hypothetical protein